MHPSSIFRFTYPNTTSALSALSAELLIHALTSTVIHIPDATSLYVVTYPLPKLDSGLAIPW